MSGTCGAGEAGGEHAQVSGEFRRLVHLELAAGQHQAEGQPFQGADMGFQPAGPLVQGGEISGGAAQAAGYLRGRRVQRGDGAVDGDERVEPAGDVGGSVGGRQRARGDPRSCRPQVPDPVDAEDPPDLAVVVVGKQVSVRPAATRRCGSANRVLSVPSPAW
jgi:hypothetical protein